MGTLWKKLLHLLQIASDFKWVSYVGLAITTLGAVCIQFNNEQLTTAFGPHAARVCGLAIIVGAFITSYGKGLADRRQRPTTPPPPENPDAGV